MKGYPIFFTSPPPLGTVVNLSRAVSITLTRIGTYRKTSGEFGTILEWQTEHGRACTSGLRSKWVYWKSIEDMSGVQKEKPMTTNLKPADELLSIRQRIKALQAREDEIKTGMKSGEMEMNGDFSIAHFSRRTTSRFDRKAAEAELGDLSRFEVKSETIAIMVTELDQQVVE